MNAKEEEKINKLANDELMRARGVVLGLIKDFDDYYSGSKHFEKLSESKEAEIVGIETQAVQPIMSVDSVKKTTSEIKTMQPPKMQEIPKQEEKVQIASNSEKKKVKQFIIKNAVDDVEKKKKIEEEKKRKQLLIENEQKLQELREKIEESERIKKRRFREAVRNTLSSDVILFTLILSVMLIACLIIIVRFYFQGLLVY